MCQRASGHPHHRRRKIAAAPDRLAGGGHASFQPALAEDTLYARVIVRYRWKSHERFQLCASPTAMEGGTSMSHEPLACHTGPAPAAAPVLALACYLDGHLGVERDETEWAGTSTE
jgi:hypothetical protein